MNQATFTLTDDHLKLLSNAYVGWEGDEYGAPEIDPKRPYGESAVANSIADILGWPMGEELTAEQRAQARVIHEETKTALQIILVTQSFRAGRYVQTRQYDRRSWTLTPTPSSHE